MKRILPWAAVITLLAAVLTWLFAHSLDPGRARQNRLDSLLRDLGGSEVAMQRNALRARAGLLRDYDPLVQAMAATQDTLAELQDLSPAGSALRARAGDLEANVTVQEGLLERFKTSNALLQNSAAFFDQLAMQVTADGQATPVASGVGSLAMAVLQLTHEASPDGASRVDANLSALAALVREFPDAPHAADAEVLVQHGRMLGGLVTDVDATLRSLLTASSQPVQAAYLAQLGRDRADGERVAGWFRAALYAVALLLAASLAALGVELRARARALRHRGETERLVAALSARLIGCAPEDTDAVLGEAVSLLGPAFLADRCYLLRPGEPVACQAWQALGVASQPGWPEAAWALSETAPGIEAGAGLVARASGLPQGPLRQGLQAAEVADWAAIDLRHGGVRIGLLGVDRVRHVRAAWPPGGLGLLALAADVVGSALRRQRLLQERIDLELRLSRARRLEAVGTFASGIAHNFNNVVGAIMGHAEMAGDGLHADEPRARHVDEIRRAGERARTLVAHILDYGSRGSRGRVPVPVAALLAEIVSLLRASLATPLSLRVPDGMDALAVAGEPGQLHQVFVNLVRNAAQASEDGGTVTVELSATTFPARTLLSHGEVAAGRHICVAVTDTGAGMDADTQRRLFQPFFTTRPGGTGLGLATAWEIVRDHEGAFGIRSAPGAGTTFEVWLPVQDAAAAGAAPSQAGNGQAVLVLNPDQAARHRDEDVLAALGYEPVGYDCADAAAAACMDAPDRFAAVLLDHGLSASGAAATAWLPFLAGQGRPGQRPGSRPVIVLGSEGPDRSAVELAGLGIVEVIARPVRSGALAAALARWI